MPIGAFKLNAIAKALDGGAAPTYVTASGGNTVRYWYNTGNSTWYQQHDFTTTGSQNFVVSAGGSVDYVIAGGGGPGVSISTGAYIGSGGGGGGQVKTGSFTTTATTYSITVGAGGTASTTAPTNGGASSAFSISSSGGVAGTTIGASNTGGTGATSGSGNTGGTGLVTTNVGAAGGGGGGNGGNGVNASTVNVAGNGGAPTTIPDRTNASGFLMTRPMLGSGGGGGVWSNAQTPGQSGATAAGGVAYGGGGGGAVTGSAGTANTATGGGGTGRATTSGSNLGGAGGSGIVLVRYPMQTAPSISFVASATSSTTTIAIPASAQTGDIVILADHAWGTTLPTLVTPTGFTAMSSPNQSATSPFNYLNVSRKILVAGDSGSTITGMSGGTGTRKTLLVFRFSVPIINSSFINNGSQATASTPTNQSLSGNTTYWPQVLIATYASSGSITTRGFTNYTPTEVSNGTGLYVKYLIQNTQPAGTAATVSMTDGGSNALATNYFYLY